MFLHRGEGLHRGRAPERKGGGPPSNSRKPLNPSEPVEKSVRGKRSEKRERKKFPPAQSVLKFLGSEQNPKSENQENDLVPYRRNPSRPREKGGGRAPGNRNGGRKEIPFFWGVFFGGGRLPTGKNSGQTQFQKSEGTLGDTGLSYHHHWSELILGP